MHRLLYYTMIFMLVGVSSVLSQETFEKDVFETIQGDLEITFVGHAMLMFRFGGKVIHVDPVTREADYNKLPQGPGFNHPRTRRPSRSRSVEDHQE